MKIGVLQFFSWPDRRFPLPEVYRRAFQRIDVMEQTGYDAVWLAEHHFSSFSVCPSIHLVGAQIAARTERLRIGTGVSLAAFYNPLRLAEEVALLDVLSGGRVNWGAGRGYQKGEFEAFGVDPDSSYDVFREHVEVVLAAWNHERVSYAGEHFQCREVEVLPKPLQQPHPPVWMAASSPESMSWAAEMGFSIMLDPHSPHPRIAEKRAFYHERLEQAGHSPEGRDLPMARLLAVAPTDAQAREVARAGAEWTVGSHAKGPTKPVEARSRLNREREELGIKNIFKSDGETSVIDRYVDSVIIHGSPERVVDQLLELRDELPLDYLLCAPLSHESFELFTDRVMPHVATTTAPLSPLSASPKAHT